MEPSCVRQTSIPGTSKLFGDFLYHFDGVKRYFSHHFSDWDRLAQSAKTIHFPEQRRAQIVSALRNQNPGSAALERLAQSGTVAVVTGQQVGLLSGPAYSIFKALTAVRVAAKLTEQGTAAVPVFWLATEDHDLAEVDHAWVFDSAANPTKILARAETVSNRPVGTVEIAEIDFEEIAGALEGFPFAESVLEKVKAHYVQGSSFGRAFHGFLKDILAGFDLVFLDPLAAPIRAISAPFMADAALRVPDLLAELRGRSADLEAAGYHAQVRTDEGSSLLFLLENGKRAALKYKDGRFVLRDRIYSAEQLADRAEALSPSALLRPVMQDYLLPTVSYVGGPSEIAYLAQSRILYDRLLGRMPVLTPRNSFTLLDARATKLLERYNLHVVDLLDSQDRVKSTIAGTLVPHDLRSDLTNVRSHIANSLGAVREKLVGFDPTLAAAADRSLAKMSYQLEKLSGKTARETMRRDHHAANDALYLSNLIYPQRHLQERFYSIVPFLAKHGLDLPQRIYEQTQLGCPDHMIRTF